MDKLAEQLYAALSQLVHDKTGMGLLSALGDLQAQVPYGKASSKTRTVFLELADNLTRLQARG